MATENLSIKIDSGPLIEQVNAICSALPVFAEAVPKHFTDLILSLADGHIPDGCISACGATSDAGDHVIRLGVAGDLELLGAALGAIESD